jgi:hypothetical protein
VRAGIRAGMRAGIRVGARAGEVRPGAWSERAQGRARVSISEDDS